MLSDQRPGADPAVIRFAGEIDAARPDVAEDLERLVGEGAERIVVDAVDVTFIDSSFVRALLLAHAACTDGGGWLRVAYTHHVVRRVIEICGLAELLPQYPTVEAARRGHPVAADADGEQASDPPTGSRQ